MLYNDLVPRSDYICHHGIKGMRWGIRRYQNPDGTLTDLGRKRLGMNDSKVSDRLSNDSDIIIKKGTVINRWTQDRDIDEYLLDEWHKAKEQKGREITNSEYDELYNKKVKKSSWERIDEYEKRNPTKHYSVDSVEFNNQRRKGEEFYAAFMMDSGYEPYGRILNTYVVKKDIRVASGKKVVDTVLKNTGYLDKSSFKKNNYMSPTYKINKAFKSFSMGSDIWKKTIDDLKNEGYDAIDDIHDLDTNLPIIGINLDSKIALQRRTDGLEWLRQYRESHK